MEKKKQKITDSINVYSILTKIGEFKLASDKKYTTKIAGIYNTNQSECVNLTSMGQRIFIYI